MEDISTDSAIRKVPLLKSREVGVTSVVSCLFEGAWCVGDGGTEYGRKRTSALGSHDGERESVLGMNLLSDLIDSEALLDSCEVPRLRHAHAPGFPGQVSDELSSSPLRIRHRSSPLGSRSIQGLTSFRFLQ